MPLVEVFDTSLTVSTVTKSFYVSPLQGWTKVAREGYASGSGPTAPTTIVNNGAAPLQIQLTDGTYHSWSNPVPGNTVESPAGRSVVIDAKLKNGLSSGFYSSIMMVRGSYKGNVISNVQFTANTLVNTTYGVGWDGFNKNPNVTIDLGTFSTVSASVLHTVSPKIYNIGTSALPVNSINITTTGPVDLVSTATNGDNLTAWPKELRAESYHIVIIKLVRDSVGSKTATITFTVNSSYTPRMAGATLTYKYKMV